LGNELREGIVTTHPISTDWRTEKAIIIQALDALLPTLDRPHLTVPLGYRLSLATGLDEKRCRTILGWLAKEGHPHATHDGGSVFSYGRSVTRWRWHPTPQHEARKAPEAAPVREMPEGWQNMTGTELAALGIELTPDQFNVWNVTRNTTKQFGAAVTLDDLMA
jgi:hypothetical protein